MVSLNYKKFRKKDVIIRNISHKKQFQTLIKNNKINLMLMEHHYNLLIKHKI